jgi:hypothetical protein
MKRGPEMDLNDRQVALADLLDAHPMIDWGPALLDAVSAVIELHFAEGGTDKAPVLTLVRR